MTSKKLPITCINIEMYKQHADKNHMIVLFVWDNTIGEILKENEPYNLRIRSNLLQDVYVVVVFKCS